MTASRFVCFGELLLRLGAPGHERLLQSPRLDVHVGGAEANVGVALAHFGHDVAMVSVLPDNPLGEAAAGELRRHGVDTRGVRFVPGRMGLYFLTTGAGHRPSEVTYDRAGSAFALAQADAHDWPALLRGADWLHLSGVTPALGERGAAAALAAARSARDLGVRVSFDGNYRPKLWEAWNGDAPGILRQLLAQADVLFADYRDLGVVLGHQYPQDGAQARVQAGARDAFAAFPQLQAMACTQRVAHSVDHHSLGAMLLRRDGSVAQAPAEELTGIVDRIGGGDAFAAGVLHGLSQGWDDTATIRFGLAAGCLKHSLPGDFHALGEADVQACVGTSRFDVKR
ncbi:sugar kinase [Xanthomonas translucens]|uniref:sugar kinase n=1 Tax=Xanthomonas campestris pv. translucens TaxID=343 RepID=UPI00071E6CCD|nr:sugar kinase [Xanthomonas translucens]QEO24843.1 sugar kinase [Xanthomonas translucens pv. undulosa]